MPATLTYPGVYVEEIPSSVHTITGVATSIAAFVGYTDSGLDNRATEVLSFSDFERSFGGLVSDSELSYAVQQFFLNGGSDAFVVRVPRHGATAAAVTLLSSVSSGTTSLVLTMLSTGTWSSQVIIDVDYDQVSDGNSFNLTITNLADGTIETWDNVTMDTSKSNFVEAVVNDVDSGSQLVKVKATVPASGITPRPAATGICGASFLLGTIPATAGKLGILNTIQTNQTNNLTSTLTLVLTPAVPNPTAQTVPINLIAPSDSLPLSMASLCTLIASKASAALATIIPGATVQCVPSSGGNGVRVSALIAGEYDAQVTFSGGAANDVGVLLNLTTAKGNVSHYWPYSQLVTPATPPVAPTPSGAFGAETAATAGYDGTGLPQAADLVGDQSLFTGIYALEKVDLFNILCIPDATRALASNSSVLDSNISQTDPNTVFSAALAYCKQRRAFLLIDPPPSVNTIPSAVDWITSGLTVKDNTAGGAAAYFPRLKLPDQNNNSQLRTFAPCGVVAGVYAATDGARGVWKAPAGIDATLDGVQSLVYKMTDNENGVLNPLGLNCFRVFPVYGPVSWGARTIAGADALASPWKYVPVRRFAYFLEESLYRGTKWVVFEPNAEPLWSSIRLNINSFMQTLFRQGAFAGQTPQTAYFVKCDSETTTQDDINLGIVNIIVGFAPLLPAEFVVLQIQQMAGQVGS
jgi:phage tail sheath protein FI